MLTGELRNQIDGIWNDFWSGGLSNPLQVIEQLTYLIFIKRLDEMQELEERKANTLRIPIERRIFPEGYDGIAKPGDPDQRGEPYANLRWSRFKHFAGPEMFRVVDEHVFPFIRGLNGEGTSYARHMRDARFQIPGPEQQRIAAILDQADDLRYKRRLALEQLDAFLDADFVSSFVSAAPSNWPEVSVAQVSKSIRTGPFGSQLLHAEFTTDGVAVLGIDNAVHNEFSWGERRYITEAKYRDLQRYRVFPRDVLITIMGTCGRAAIVPDDIPLAINTKHLCCLTLNEDRCLPEFLQACFLRHPSVLHQLGIRERGSIMGGLNMGLIKETRLPLPPLGLQRAFTARLAEIKKLRGYHRAHLGKLDLLFSSLQQRAFRGELWYGSNRLS